MNVDQEIERSLNKNVKSIIALISGILIATIFLNTIVVIQAGNRGILLEFGAVKKVLTEGIYFIIPFVQKVEIISVRVGIWTESTSAGTSDLQTVTTDVALNYHLNPLELSKIYQRIGKDVTQIIISPAIDESVKAITAQFTAEELLTNRTVVKDRLTNELEFRLSEFDIVLDEISITNFKFSPEFDAAIEAKQVAQQRAQQEEQELIRVEIEAQQQVVQAEAQAHAILSVAEAQSQANELLTVSLTDSILRRMWIDKWDGILPTYMLGQDATLLLDIKTS